MVMISQDPFKSVVLENNKRIDEGEENNVNVKKFGRCHKWLMEH